MRGLRAQGWARNPTRQAATLLCLLPSWPLGVPPSPCPSEAPRRAYLLNAASLLRRAFQLPLQPLIVPLKPGILPQHSLQLGQLGTA